MTDVEARMGCTCNYAYEYFQLRDIVNSGRRVYSTQPRIIKLNTLPWDRNMVVASRRGLVLAVAPVPRRVAV